MCAYSGEDQAWGMVKSHVGRQEGVGWASQKSQKVTEVSQKAFPMYRKNALLLFIMVLL